jgi:hypothetical protein
MLLGQIIGTWQIATPDLDRVLTLVVAVNYIDLPQPVTCNAAVQGTFRQSR